MAPQRATPLPERTAEGQSDAIFAAHRCGRAATAAAAATAERVSPSCASYCPAATSSGFDCRGVMRGGCVRLWQDPRRCISISSSHIVFLFSFSFSVVDTTNQTTATHAYRAFSFLFFFFFFFCKNSPDVIALLPLCCHTKPMACDCVFGPCLAACGSMFARTLLVYSCPGFFPAAIPSHLATPSWVWPWPLRGAARWPPSHICC